MIRYIAWSVACVAAAITALVLLFVGVPWYFPLPLLVVTWIGAEGIRRSATRL